MRNKYALVVIIGTCITVSLNALAYLITTKKVEYEDDYFSYKNTMSRNDAESVLAIIHAEGFDQAFNHLSSFNDIGDHKFHELRKAYIASSKQLIDYLAEAADKPDQVPYYLKY